MPLGLRKEEVCYDSRLFRGDLSARTVVVVVVVVVAAATLTVTVIFRD